MAAVVQCYHGPVQTGGNGPSWIAPGSVGTGHSEKISSCGICRFTVDKDPIAQMACGVDQYSQMTPVENQNQLPVNSAEETAVGTLTPHHTLAFVRRDERKELEQEKQDMQQRQADLERRELAVQQRQGEVARNEFQLRNREAECNKWERAVWQNRTVLQKKVERKKVEWQEEAERREREWQEVLKKREVEAI